MKPLIMGSVITAAFGLATAPAHAAADDLFISEYVEGSSFNKAIELANATGSPVDLSSYQLEYYFNGNSSPSTTIPLSGSLADGDVFVVASASASAEILAIADLTSSANFFNGDDAVVLRGGGAIIDVIGQIGFDPGSEWGSGNISTQNNTIRRQTGVCVGDSDGSDAFDPAAQWDGFAQDDITDLGSHTADPDCDGEGGGGGGPDPVPALISAVQGPGAASPLDGQAVIIDAIVVGDYQGSDSLNGFYVQEEDADADADPATSEGVFVFDNGAGPDVQVGDRVTVTGTVVEFFGETQIGNATVELVSSGNALPTPAQITFPLASVDDLEPAEGMQVEFAQTLTVTENFNLGRFGELFLSFGGRLMQPTNVAYPGAEAAAVQDANNLRRILLDDAKSIQNPDPIAYPSPELTADNTLRSGYTVTGLVGVLGFGFSNYRVQPVEIPTFVDDNPRQSSPDDVGGTIRVASFNVLNYFNGDGLGGGFPTARGANTPEEFARQHDKIVSAIVAMDADIIGLMEIENDGYASTSAIQELVDGLNLAAPAGTTYAFVDPGVPQIGTDQIAVGFIYRTETVVAAGPAAILDSSVDPRFNDQKNRPALAQAFIQLETGGLMTVAVNHFKSKGSDCDELGDPDVGDGQGNCNLTRTAAAQALVDWLASDPLSTLDGDFLVIGDLNSYAKEDPIGALKVGGYVDLVHNFQNSNSAYSFIFNGQAGYLDHALATSVLTRQVTGLTVWHINTDEPRSLDYNTEFKSPRQVEILYAPDSFRASDHDPVILGLTLTPSSEGRKTPPRARTRR
ncbi:MAG: ExeM/NucH family extracellular endonuclease [Haliangiales bacterium]